MVGSSVGYLLEKSARFFQTILFKIKEVVTMGPYYSLAVRRFRTILGVGLRIFSYFRGGLRLTNDGSVTENFAFSLGFRYFMHFHKRITVLKVAVSV